MFIEIGHSYLSKVPWFTPQAFVLDLSFGSYDINGSHHAYYQAHASACLPRRVHHGHSTGESHTDLRGKHLARQLVHPFVGNPMFFMNGHMSVF